MTPARRPVPPWLIVLTTLAICCSGLVIGGPVSVPEPEPGPAGERHFLLAAGTAATLLVVYIAAMILASRSTGRTRIAVLVAAIVLACAAVPLFYLVLL